ncbi:MAG: T9SS type A sorting domain-containing protein, partial [Chitinophagales bacterium]
GFYDIHLDTTNCSTILHLTVYEVTIDTSIVNMGTSLHSPAHEVLFQWFDCNTDMPVPGAVQSDFTPASIGFYRVRLTTIQGCEAFSDCYLVLPVATHEPVNEIQWQIFPNPADDFLVVNVDWQLQQDVSIEIIDLLGRCQLKKALSPGNSEIRLDLKTIAPGMYFAILSKSGNISDVKPFIKIGN